MNFRSKIGKTQLVRQKISSRDSKIKESGIDLLVEPSSFSVHIIYFHIWPVLRPNWPTYQRHQCRMVKWEGSEPIQQRSERPGQLCIPDTNQDRAPHLDRWNINPREYRLKHHSYWLWNSCLWLYYTFYISIGWLRHHSFFCMGFF